MEARSWRGAPICRGTVKLHVGVQLLADRLVSTQLTSSEAGRKKGSVDYSTQQYSLVPAQMIGPAQGSAGHRSSSSPFCWKRSLRTGQCQTLHGFLTLLCVPDIQREE